ncbi:MAG: hypothetical protein QOJ17_260 [Rhodospirillaceae bacterium]|nr:hypothetical protein [Rhodospirillaceae bacterium]
MDKLLIGSSAAQEGSVSRILVDHALGLLLQAHPGATQDGQWTSVLLTPRTGREDGVRVGASRPGDRLGSATARRID